MRYGYYYHEECNLRLMEFLEKGKDKICKKRVSIWRKGDCTIICTFYNMEFRKRSETILDEFARNEL